MKKYLNPLYLPIFLPLAAVLGFVLRLWTIGNGPNSEGLYAPQPVAWVLLWLVTIATIGCVILMSRPLNKPGRYADNFPKSILGAAGCAAAAIGMGISALPDLTNSVDLLATLTGFLGVLSAVSLLLTGWSRFQGVKPSFVLHVIPCLGLALRIFDRCKYWSNEPQTGVFLFQFLASACVMLAMYQMCCFDVNLGNRKSSLLWSLSGAYFCVLALPMGEEPLFYAGMALWVMTNLCSVRPLRVAKPEATEPVQADVPVKEPGQE